VAARFQVIPRWGGQGFVGRESWGWIHYAIIVAFVGLFIGTSIVAVEDDISFFARLMGFRLHFFYGDFYHFFKAAMDTYLIATVAGQNVETLNRYKPKRIVTQCPYCYYNLKNEYPDFGLENVEVTHEAEFIDELIRNGRLTPNKELV
jgi:hypothetical protein